MTTMVKTTVAAAGAMAALAAGAGEIRMCCVGSAAGGPDGESLHVLKCDVDTGEISLAGSVRGFQGTTYFEFDRDGRHLYAAGTEIPPRRGAKADALRFPFGSGGLGAPERLGELPCEAPCHVGIFPGDGRPFYAAYSSAMLSAVAPGGAVKSAVLGDEGAGPDKSRQKKAYAHAVFFTPDRKLAGVVNLGCDRIHFFDAETLADTGRIVRLDPGDGPRHAVWSRCARRLYVLNELSNSVAAFSFTGGEFVRIGKWPTLPAGFEGWSKAAAIKLTADGKILMASNRGHDSIAFFAVDPVSGGLAFKGASPLTGSFPRDFELMPGEKFMVVGHKRSDEVRAYRFDRERFAIEPAGKAVKVWRPLCFKFAPAGEAR
jgi:6-phosphogluconolactonase